MSISPSVAAIYSWPLSVFIPASRHHPALSDIYNSAKLQKSRENYYSASFPGKLEQYQINTFSEPFTDDKKCLAPPCL